MSLFISYTTHEYNRLRFCSNILSFFNTFNSNFLTNMDHDQIYLFRETSRNILFGNRKNHRDEEADLRRSVESKRITPSTVLNIANKLKTKSMISVSELQMLKNSLLDNVTNIEVVLNIHGSLRGLVRELSGHDVNKQCASAGCLCNLALGDSKAGLAVSKAAGVYLVATLNNLTSELAITCAWTIGNLAGSGLRACELLTSQGAISKLIELIDSTNDDMRDAAVYALEHFAYQLRDELKTEHLNKTLQSLSRIPIVTSSRLLFILSCHKGFTCQLLSEEYILTLVQYLSVSVNNCMSNQRSTDLVYVLRFFANMNSKEVYDMVLRCFVENNLIDGIKILLNVSALSESLLWLLGNMYSHTDHMFFTSLVT